MSRERWSLELWFAYWGRRGPERVVMRYGTQDQAERWAYVELGLGGVVRYRVHGPGGDVVSDVVVLDMHRRYPVSLPVVELKGDEDAALGLYGDEPWSDPVSE